MIKLMKLWFSCCLIFGATFVNGGITEEETFDPYKTLQEIDEKFWQQIYTYHQKQLKRYQKTLAGLFDAECSISQNVTNYLEPFYASNGLPKLFGEPTPIDISKNSTLDFSSASMLNIISMFYEILQCKAYYRDDREGGYNTNSIGLLGKIGFNEDNFGLLNNGKMIDPYFTKINIAEKEYHLHFNYSGGKNSKQPGNCCLKQGNESPQKWINGRTYNCKLLDNDHYILQNLLLCLEVSRRKVEDGDRLDVYCKLPILGAIIMGLELMNTQKIIKNDFFVGKYCCFSKKEREKNIKNLLYTFFKYKKSII